MAAPIASKITLPTDTGNSGKNVRTQTREVGADTVHEHFFVPTMEQAGASKFFFSSTQQTVSATVHDGTATGFFWLELPNNTGFRAIIRRISVDCNAGSALATPTAPVLSFSKFSFSGTGAGATVDPVKYREAAAANEMIIHTAVTGLTVDIIGDVGQFAFPSAETAVGCFYAQKEVLPFNPLAYQRGMALEIDDNEGLVIWQSVAGTVSDTRRFGVQIEWDEIDVG